MHQANKPGSYFYICIEIVDLRHIDNVADSVVWNCIVTILSFAIFILQ